MEKDGNGGPLGLKKPFYQPLVEERKSITSSAEGRPFFTVWSGWLWFSLEIWEGDSFFAEKSLHQLLVEGKKSQTTKLGGLVVCEFVHPQTNIKSGAGPRPWFIMEAGWIWCCHEEWKILKAGLLIIESLF